MGINYYAYIQSDEWRQRADAAKQRAGHRCQVCNRSSIQVTLDAHHRTYERLGNERPEDITVLCRDCHGLYELNKKTVRPPQYTPVLIAPNQYQQKASFPTRLPSTDYQATPKQDKTSNQTVLPKEIRPDYNRVSVTIIGTLFTSILLVTLIVNMSSNKMPASATLASTAVRMDATNITQTKIQVKVNQGVKIFGGPSTGHAVLGTLTKGTTVVILGYTLCDPDTWYRIGKDHWIASEAVDSKPVDVLYVEGVCSPSLTRQETTSTPVPSTATPTPTEAPTKVPTEAPTAAPAEVYRTVNRGANIRQGPGTSYPVARTVAKGAKLTIAGYTTCNSNTWYQVGAGQWIADFLVNGGGFDVPYVEIECKVAVPSTPTRLPPTATPKSVATAANCAGGCIVYPAWCASPIKGNISYNTGEKIYHVPGQEYYDATVINPSDGERWFCTEQEA